MGSFPVGSVERITRYSITFLGDRLGFSGIGDVAHLTVNTSPVQKALILFVLIGVLMAATVVLV